MAGVERRAGQSVFSQFPCFCTETTEQELPRRELGGAPGTALPWGLPDRLDETYYPWAVGHGATAERLSMGLIRLESKVRAVSRMEAENH